MVMANGAISPTIIGDTQTLVGSPSAIVPTATEPLLTSFDTSTTLNNAVGTNSTSTPYRVGNNVTMVAYALITTTTDELWFLGYTDTALSSSLIPGAPGTVTGINGVGFSWCSSSGTFCNGGTGDTTNFQCATNNGGTTWNRVSTGVAADTSLHKFEIFMDDTNSRVTFKIDGNSVCSSPISTQYPTSTTLMKFELGMKQGNNVVAKKTRLAVSIMESDIP